LIAYIYAIDRVGDEGEPRQAWRAQENEDGEEF